MSEHVLDHLSTYLDGELSDAERERFRAHLAACGECAQRLAELVAVDDTVRRQPAEVPVGYFEELPSRIRARASQATLTRRQPRVPPWALAAAAVLLVGVLAPLALREQPVPAPPREDVVVAPAKRRAELLPASRPTPQPPTVVSALQDKLTTKNEFAKKDARADAATAPAAPPPAPPAPAAAAGTKGFAEAPGGAPAAAEQAPQLRQQAEGQKEELAVAGPMSKQQNATAAVARDEPRAKTADLDRARLVGRPEAKLPAASTRELLEATPTSAAAARELRERCRRLAAEAADPSQADAGRVRVVEMSVLAWQLDHLPKDRDAAVEDGEAYLARADAVQRERVRDLLARVRN